MRSSLKMLTLGLAAVAWTGGAGAVDVANTMPPVKMAEPMLTVGERNLQLPPGDWTLVARDQNYVTIEGVDRQSPRYRAYAMNVAGGAFVQGGVLRLPLNSSMVNFWKEDDCKINAETRALLRDDLGSNIKLPKCLMVLRRGSHLRHGAPGSFYEQAAQWAGGTGVRIGGGDFYEVFYSDYASNDQGSIHVYLPARGRDETAVLSWARSLPPILSPLFERRTTSAVLPPLPVAH